MWEKGTQQATLKKDLSFSFLQWPTAVRLFVACSNEPAITLYKKFGMAVINTVTNYYGKGSHAHTMQFTVRMFIFYLKRETAEYDSGEDGDDRV